MITENKITQKIKFPMILSTVFWSPFQIALDRTEAGPTPNKVETPLLKKVRGIATPQAVIAVCPIIFLAKILSMRGYSPITIIPITAGMDSWNISDNGVLVNNCSFMFCFILTISFTLISNLPNSCFIFHIDQCFIQTSLPH